jgi:hypothetical protein
MKLGTIRERSALLSAGSKRAFASFSLFSESLPMANMLVEFENYPKERELIGTLLIAYAEIEFALFSLIAAVLGDTQDNAVQIFFRIRGEGARIEVSDAIVRPFLTKHGLGPKWSNAIGPLRLCKKIRNQYAHCHWMLINENLSFLDFDSAVESSSENSKVSMRAVDNALLQKQRLYFEYALDWLYYLASE